MPVKKKKTTTKNPLVSVIIAAFNEGNKVGRAIESILNQDYKNLELFVVDDGSKDNTREVVSSYSKKHKNVHLLKQNRKGPGAAKNLAFSKSKGKIIVFSDADEYMKKNYVSLLVDPILKGKSQTSAGAWYVAFPKSPWARCRFQDSHEIRIHGVNSKVFRAIKASDFKKLGGFDPSKGYSDDRLGETLEKSQVPEAIFDHDVDSNPKELFQKRKWIGSSIKNNPKNKKFWAKTLIGLVGLLVLLNLLIFQPLWALYLVILGLIPTAIKAISKTLYYKDPRLLFYYPIYSIICLVGMTIGFLKAEYKK